MGLADAVPEGRDWLQALMPLQGLAGRRRARASGRVAFATSRLTGWAALPVDVFPTQLRKALEMVDAGFAVGPE